MTSIRQLPLQELQEGVQKIQALLEEVTPKLDQDDDLHRQIQNVQEIGEKIVGNSRHHQ